MMFGRLARVEEIRGLSITLPWALLIAILAKIIETRSWSTPYRGLVAIHASKGFPKDCQALCHREPFSTALIDAGVSHRPETMPAGMVIAVARLEVVLASEDILAGWDRVAGRREDAAAWAAREMAFGDFSEKRFGWFWSDLVKLKTPVPAKGALGLWKFTDQPDAEAAIRAQLKAAA